MINGHALGDTADPDSRAFQREAILRARPKRAPTAIEQKLAAEYALHKPRQAELQKTVSPPYTVAAPGPLSEIGKQFQKMVLARDWDALFNFLPPKKWGQHGMLGKYSFVEKGGKRIYIPFTEPEIRAFVFSPYYTVQPGYTCTDEQREMGVAALMKAGARHQQKFPNTDYRHIWPIYPGWGYPGQRYGCEKYVPSTWVKIRKPVAIAAGVVAAVYLGPMVVDKIGALTGGGGSAAATGEAATGIVGAGTKAGAVAKAGVGAKAVGAGAAATAAETATFFTKVKTGANSVLGYVNKGRTIEAIAKGELPPPPIGITGSNFTEWAVDVAKKELKDELMKTVSEKMADEMVKREEKKIRAEIEQLQRELNKVIPADLPMHPAAGVPVPVQQVMEQEKIKSEEMTTAALAIGLPVAAFFMLS